MSAIMLLLVLPFEPLLISGIEPSDSGYAEPVDVEFVSRADGSRQRYVRLLPADFDTRTPHDVLIALHGHGADRWQFVKQDRPECREMRRIAAERGMVFVSPDYRAPTSWLGPAAEDDLLQIIDELHGEFRIRNVIVAGGSMGGTAALAFAALHPKCVDGVVALNGTANLIEYTNFQDAIQASYGGTKEQVPEVYRSRSAELFPDHFVMPIATTTGGQDTLVPPVSVLRLMSVLEKRGGKVRSIHRSEGGHDTNAEDTSEALTFVLDAVAERSVTPALIPTETLTATPHRIVCLGDSVTGIYYHTGGRRAYPEMLQAALNAALPDAQCLVLNAGISGHTTRDGLNRLENDVLKHQPQIVTISFGLNDVVRVPEEEFRSNLRSLVEQCQQAGAKVVLCTPNAVIDTGDRPITKLELYCAIIREVATETQSAVCDQFARGNRLKQRAPQTWRLTMSDAIHPNMAGHKRMAEELCRTISGLETSTADLGPLEPLLFRTRDRLAAGQTVNVIVMSPLEEAIRRIAKDSEQESLWKITRWDITGKTLSQLEQEAQQQIRPQKPDLVILTIPVNAELPDFEQKVHSISWLMNWSLDFGTGGWDCVVVHPAVIDPQQATEASQDCSLIRELVHAQDLPLIDRADSGTQPMEDLIADWFRQALDK